LVEVFSAMLAFFIRASLLVFLSVVFTVICEVLLVLCCVGCVLSVLLSIPFLSSARSSIILSGTLLSLLGRSAASGVGTATVSTVRYGSFGGRTVVWARNGNYYRKALR